MANRAVELAIEIASRASTAGMDATVAAAKEMRSQVEAAADSTASRLDRVAGASENLDDKAGRATGALGALSSGFELVGLEKYAEGLNAVAMATDFASGVGQALSLALELESVQRAKAVVVSGAHAVATTAQAGAAKAAAVAQGALNVVLAANPVALVVIAVVALVAAFVLAYKRSETFRTIVQAAMATARAGIEAVIGVVTTLVGWITGRASAAWSVLRDAVVVTISVVRERIATVLDTARDIFTKVQDTIAGAIDAAKEKVEWFRDRAVDAFNLIMTPIDAIKDAITWIIEKLATIKIPKIDLPFGGDGRFGGNAPGTGFPGYSPPAMTFNLHVTTDPLADPNAIAAAIVAQINAYLVRIGITPVAV
jgi:phage-related protein